MRARILAFLVFMMVSWAHPFPPSARAADGEALYHSLHCNSCHKSDKKAAGESLPTLAKAYESEENLIKFFKGEAGPRVRPEVPPVMKGRMDVLKALGDPDQKALASYILSFR